MDELRKLRASVYNLSARDWIKLTDEEWYEELWKLLDPVVDARIERSQQALDDALARKRKLAPEATPAPAPVYKNWGVAWFSRTGENGSCERCGRGGRVYQGYNGGAHMGLFCGPCRRPVMLNEA